MKTIATFFFAVWCLILQGSLAMAQDLRNLSGIVTAFHNYPLNKVLIFSKKSGETKFTDPEGNFTIRSTPGDLLVVSASGFRGRKVRVKNSEFLNIDLPYLSNDANFDHAVNDGHINAEHLKKAIAGTMIPATRDYSKYNSIYDLISSEVYNVRVRGNTVVNTKMRSLDTTPEVLLVVDDKIVHDISFIDPSWVRSVELIDDVRTSMYGVMGANGVLKIMLK